MVKYIKIHKCNSDYTCMQSYGIKATAFISPKKVKSCILKFSKLEKVLH